GGYLIGGRSFSGISGDKTEASIGDFSTYDFWVLKLNSSGNIEWQNTIGGSSTDDLTSLQQTSDGGYILGGYSTSGVSGDKTEASKGAGDYWVVKLNSSGFITWQNTIGGSGEDVLISVSQTSDGGYILGGSSCSNISADKSENNITGWCEWKDYWIIKLNGSGNIVWDNTIGGTENDECVSVFQTAEGGYIIGGYSNSGTSTDKSENNFSGGEYGWDFWIVKLDYTGTIIQWENTIGSAGPWPYGDDYLNSSVQETADGGYIIGGTSYGGISGDKTAANIGSFDFWVIKLLPFCTVGEAELCNHLDDDCDGLIDEGEITETIIISPTGSTSFCTGGSVILNATYSGSTVQWKRNGINIPGATSPSITASKTGTYTCETFSDCDTTLSAAIVVTENKNPNATISAGGPTTFCAGGSVILTEVAVAGCTYQWYKGATPIAGATSLTYTATTSGNYKCRVTKAVTGCYKNSNAIAVSVPCREGLPAGEAGDNLIENTFSLYPNPANNFITIETDFSTEKTIYITDALGQIVKTIITSENYITIDLQGIASGIYFIKMEDGINSVSQKFVKQ
ncbi:MAG TPA: T9SS type A sorting domain-containing protein, partial [Chitinophagales bacterium]|nr:T9SS type A sorting domain-containing protein [Chitinophagales bacterium]